MDQIDFDIGSLGELFVAHGKLRTTFLQFAGHAEDFMRQQAEVKGVVVERDDGADRFLCRYFGKVLECRFLFDAVSGKPQGRIEFRRLYAEQPAKRTLVASLLFAGDGDVIASDPPLSIQLNISKPREALAVLVHALRLGMTSEALR
ncbi:MAG TPA: hypothetical protein VM937_03335 [Burkholderiaceae bacterium]|jgi:hypothetical protein|nr:hypothetical protein [Burkholderiaceae bacterium]